MDGDRLAVGRGLERVVHTAAFPGGAARGQLMLIPPSPNRTVLTGSLSGANEVPPNGTPTSGPVLVIVDTESNLVCVTIALQNQRSENIVAMHIHKAPAGVNGPVVIPFTPPALDQCTIGPDAVVDDLAANPTNYYFNIHTAAFPGGRPEHSWHRWPRRHRPAPRRPRPPQGRPLAL
jgi:hypothetical protein